MSSNRSDKHIPKRVSSQVEMIVDPKSTLRQSPLGVAPRKVSEAGDHYEEHSSMVSNKHQKYMAGSDSGFNIHSKSGMGSGSGHASPGQRRPLELQTHIPEPTFEAGRDNTDDGDSAGAGADSQKGEETVGELRSTGHDSSKAHKLAAVNVGAATGRRSSAMPAVAEHAKYPPMNFSVLAGPTNAVRSYYG